MISQLVHDDGPDGPMSSSEIVNNTILPSSQATTPRSI
jgi:hypothetical protein